MKNNTDEEKRFNEWNELKKDKHLSTRVPAVKEGEIWWCAVGENVGVEINGKHDMFSRPVLVFKKLSRFGFLGVPLTTQQHDGDWYVPFVFRDKTSIAVLSQVRTFSTLRLYRRMGTLPETDFNSVAAGFNKLYKIR